MEQKILTIQNMAVQVLKKDIKNIHLNVLPPDGRVRVSVPRHVQDETIRLFIIKKLPWIKKHIANFQAQARQSERQYISGESHYFKGQRYIMRVEHASRPNIEIRNKKYIYLFVPAHYDTRQKRNYYENWLRKNLREDLIRLIPKWEKKINVQVNEIKIKKMKTRWGTCNPEEKRIWINLELVKKPEKHLEYIIVHELVHLLEKKHNERFKKLMDDFMPGWQNIREELNKFIL